MLSGTLITLLGAGLWGLNAVVSKYLMASGVDTMWMVNFRMITSGLVLLIFALFKNPHGIFDIWKDRKSVVRLLVISVFAFGLCQPTYYLSIDYSNAGIASAIQQTAPVFVLIYVIIKERRKPFPAELGALALVITGSFLKDRLRLRRKDRVQEMQWKYALVRSKPNGRRSHRRK